jgi:hypothetical protein
LDAPARAIRRSPEFSSRNCLDGRRRKAPRRGGDRFSSDRSCAKHAHAGRDRCRRRPPLPARKMPLTARIRLQCRLTAVGYRGRHGHPHAARLGCLGVHQADEQDRNGHRSQTEENEQSNQPEQRIYLGQHISLHASAEEPSAEPCGETLRLGVAGISGYDLRWRQIKSELTVRSGPCGSRLGSADLSALTHHFRQCWLPRASHGRVRKAFSRMSRDPSDLSSGRRRRCAGRSADLQR